MCVFWRTFNHNHNSFYQSFFNVFVWSFQHDGSVLQCFHSESPPPRLYLLHPPPPLQFPPPQARPPAPLLPLGVQKQSNDKSDKMQIKWIQQIFTHPTELTLLCLLPGQRGNRNTSQLMHSHCHEQSTTPNDERRWMLLYSLVFLFYVWHGCNKEKQMLIKSNNITNEAVEHDKAQGTYQKRIMLG